jgi:hypothetical protein
MLFVSDPSAQQVAPVLLARSTLSAADPTSTCTATGTSCVVLNIADHTRVAVQITGTCGTCQVNFEMAVDGTNYVAQNMFQPDSTTAQKTGTSPGVWAGTVGPGTFRARLHARSSGSFVVTVRASR